MSRRAASAALSRLSWPPLIGLAHGSRHSRVATATSSLLAAAGRLAGTRAETAFLDLTEPDLTSLAVQLAGSIPRTDSDDADPAPATAIVVPLLFTAAYHSRVDVPAAIERAAAVSGLNLVLAGILGTGDDLLDVLQHQLRAAGAGADEPVLLYAVGSSQPAANAAVADLALRLANLRAAAVTPAFATTQPLATELLAAAGARRPGTVLPLFVGPGLLLDQLAPIATAAGWRLAAPLGTSLAPLVAERYRSAGGQPGNTGGWE